MATLLGKCLLICVVYSMCLDSAETTESFINNDLTYSYFDVLNSFSSHIRFSKDAEKIDNFRNISFSLFHMYRHLTNLIFDDFGDVHVEKLTNIKKTASNENNNSSKLDIFEEIVAKYKWREALRNISVDKHSASFSTCLHDMRWLFFGLLNKKHWAIQFFDATGKPGPSITELSLKFLGNYEQCRAARAPHAGGFKGNYINLVAKLHGLPLQILLGACLPDTCTDLEVTVLLNQVLLTEIGGKKFEKAYSYSLKAETEVTSATIAAILILSIISFLVITGTTYDIVFIQMKKWTHSKGDLMASDACADNGSVQCVAIITDNRDNAVSNTEKTPLIAKANTELNTGKCQGIIKQVLISFSAYTNGKKLLNTTQAPSSMSCIHGLRFISMSWVILAHLFIFGVKYGANEIKLMQTYLKRWTFLPIANGFVSVDTFFAMSGLLTSYLTIQEFARRKTWKIKWSLFYFHRFWRLTPAYMFVMTIFLGLQQYWGKGPLWAPVQPTDKLSCEKNWWTNLLYINNIVGYDKRCFGHTWYLANDMQFFVLSPLMMIPFYFHRLAGILSCCVFLMASWITTGILSTKNHWQTTSVSLHPAPEKASNTEWEQYYYMTPWCRIGPYVIGVMAGYFLTSIEGRQFTMPKWVAALGWLTAMVAGLAIVYGLHRDIVGDHPTSIEVGSFYNAVHSSAWSACVCWVIISCHTGYGGPVNRILSWSPFVVLSRLTYMTYLFHLSVIIIFFQNQGALVECSDMSVIVYFLGMLSFVTMIAFVGVLMLESPIIALERVLIRRDRKD